MENILLIDCNNFFASCEELFNPSLKGKAICVLSNNNGCIVARSNAAKNLGVPMGMPYFMAKKKFKNVIYLSGNLKKYSEISKRIMKKLYDFTPSVEQYSIDEAFLDIKGCLNCHKKTPLELAVQIRKEIKEEIGIDVSIGVSKTKTLSKIASEIAKSQIRKNLQTETLGVYEINKNNLDKILENTPIQEVWGIGSNLHKFFRKHNIINAKMFVKLDDSFIQRNLGKKGLELKMELIGIKAYPVIDYYVAPKSISRSSSFSEFTTDKAYIINELNGHLHRVCIKLRNHNLRAGVLSVMLRTKDFRVDSEKFVFDIPKDSEFELYETMHRLFNFLYKKGVIYRSSGVTVSKLTDKEDIQLILFESDADKKKKKLSSAWDKIEQKFGYGAISVGIKKKNKEEK